MQWKFWQPQKTIAVHNGSFHADDVFAAATLSLWLEKKGMRYKIIRERDEYLLAKADYVLDVGGIYDHESRRYDHHQAEGAGMHSNGIDRAAFGLIWKHYGLELCNSYTDVWENIEDFLVRPLDASDNGFDIYTLNEYQTKPVELQSIIHWLSYGDNNQQFHVAVQWARKLLVHIIAEAVGHYEKGQDLLREFDSRKNPEKKYVVFEGDYGRRLIWDMLDKREESKHILYAVYAKDAYRDNAWNIVAMRQSLGSKESRQPLPEAWRGLRDDELQEVTGIADVTFCHRTGFLAVAQTQEAAIKLAQKALED